MLYPKEHPAMTVAAPPAHWSDEYIGPDAAADADAVHVEEVAAAYPRLDWYNDLATARAMSMADPVAYANASSEEKRAMLETHGALRRIGELQKELLAWVGGRPILMERDQRSIDRGALTHAAIEHWFLQRDIRCRIRIDPGGLIGFDSAGFVES